MVTPEPGVKYERPESLEITLPTFMCLTSHDVVSWPTCTLLKNFYRCVRNSKEGRFLPLDTKEGNLDPILMKLVISCHLTTIHWRRRSGIYRYVEGGRRQRYKWETFEGRPCTVVLGRWHNILRTQCTFLVNIYETTDRIHRNLKFSRTGFIVRSLTSLTVYQDHGSSSGLQCLVSVR